MSIIKISLYCIYWLSYHSHISDLNHNYYCYSLLLVYCCCVITARLKKVRCVFLSSFSLALSFCLFPIFMFLFHTSFATFPTNNESPKDLWHLSKPRQCRPRGRRWVTKEELDFKSLYVELRIEPIVTVVQTVCFYDRYFYDKHDT